EQLLPLRSVGAIAAQPGVDLELHRSGSGCRGDPIELLTIADPDIDSRGNRLLEVLPGSVQPGQQRGVDAGVAQLSRLREVGDAEPLRTAVERGARDGDGSVAVAVRLHDGEHGRATRGLTQQPDVVGDGAQIDESLTEGAAGHGRLSAIT